MNHTGPFYPVVDFSDYDNNLTDPATDEDPYTGCDDVMLAEAVYGELVDVSCDVEAE